MRSHERRRVKAEPSMTAMIDVVFLLLLFFVLSSTFVLQPGIKVKFPSTVTTERPARKDLVLIIARDKRIFLNNELVKFNSLWGRLVEELKFQQEAALVLRADRDVAHGFVVRVMDVAKQAGAERIAIATSPLDRSKKVR